MNEVLHRAIETAVREATGRAVAIADSTPVGGGCINDARLLLLAGGGRLFAKSNRSAPPEMFEREAEGLRALAAAGAIRVPGEPIAGRAGDTAFLVMEAVPTGRPKAGFFADFGCRFARLHRDTIREASAPFGFPHDNYLGSTPQPNAWTAGWVELFRERRLGHQLRLARERGLSDAELDRLGDRLLDRLGDWLDLPDEPACLLHGDLWSGNFMSDDQGDPVLIDPAAYYGHREADLAMTELFGGFDRAFYDAYEAEWPLPPGSPERRELYKLYHLLNHLNLFGRGYRACCLAILRRFVG
jgi:fructosamine-3-kinase